MNEWVVSGSWVLAFIGLSSPLQGAAPNPAACQIQCLCWVARLNTFWSKSDWIWIWVLPLTKPSGESHLTSLSFKDVISKWRRHHSTGWATGSTRIQLSLLPPSFSSSSFFPIFLSLSLFLEFHDKWNSSHRGISFLVWSFPWIPLYIPTLESRVTWTT